MLEAEPVPSVLYSHNLLEPRAFIRLNSEVLDGKPYPTNRARSAEFKAAVLARYQERYPDFGPTLATEKLALDGLLVITRRCVRG